MKIVSFLQNVFSFIFSTIPLQKHRIQKLKKKSGLLAEDDVFVFYHFHEDAANLKNAIETQFETIKNSVKKPMFPAHKKANLLHVGVDAG